MNVSELVYIGIKGSVVALDRTTGKQVWATHLKAAEFVNVVLDSASNQIFATTHGEVFCLNARTGDGIWQNPLKGFGLGLATIALAGGSSEAPPVILAEKRRQDEAAASSTTTAAAAAS